MKKKLAALLIAALTLGLTACGQAAKTEEPAAEQNSEVTESQMDEADHMHTIGVMVYSLTDEEVLARKKYLEGYIEDCFNVDFVYSNAIMTLDEGLEFIKNAADYGCDGIISFNTHDIEQEVALCEENEMYYMMGSETIHEDLFEVVADNPWFIGVVGPGEEEEYKAGVNMTDFFIDKAFGDEYFVMTGGAGMGNEMHRQRTMGILDTLSAAYGAEVDSEGLASTAEIQHIQIGNATVCLAPGYVQMPETAETIQAEYEQDQFPCVLSVYNGSVIADSFKEAHVAIVDCFSEQNLEHFNNGRLDYVTGKYGSIVGPAFAAMYNAVTGHADQFRDNGRAFKMEQGFWAASSKEEFEEKYMVAASLEIQAYNYDDLRNVTIEYNENATLDDLKALTKAYTYEDVCERRGLN